MIDKILWPVISLGGMGLLFGAGLAFASKKFAVESDPRLEAIRGILPGVNCGACGYPGCDGYAAALVNGEAKPAACPVGGPSLAERIGEMLGMEVDLAERQVARVLCQGDCHKAVDKYRYEGIQDCVAASMLAGGHKGCSYGCLGLGTCVRACPFDAIYINDGGIAQVDSEKCTACGKCVTACPKNIIELIPYSSKVQVACISKEKGKDVKAVCKVGCIGCRICVKTCRYDAIHVNNNLAAIDYDKCTNCFECARKCPTKSIYADYEDESIAAVR